MGSPSAAEGCAVLGEHAIPSAYAKKTGDPSHTDEEVIAMKALTRLSLVIVVGLAAFLPFAAAVQAKAIVYYYTGSESCVPTSMGTWTYPDGNIHIRGMIFDCTENHRQSFHSRPQHRSDQCQLESRSRGDAGWYRADVGYLEDGELGRHVRRGHDRGRRYLPCPGKRKGPYRGMKQWVNTDHGIVTGRILDPHGG